MYRERNNFDRRIFNNGKKSNKKRFFIYGITILIVLLFAIGYSIKNRADKDAYDDGIVGTILQNQNKSIFNVKELNSHELRDRIILLNVYNIKDFSYIFSVGLANRLENIFKNKVVIIDVITDNIDLDNNVIINYIIKNNIERPVINIENLNLDNTLQNKNKYFVLIDNKGRIVEKFVDNQINEENIKNSINQLLSNNPKINTEELSTISLEKTKNPESFIKSLEHIEYINKIDGSGDGPYFIISDSRGRKVYFLTINGNIVNQLGNGNKGAEDGSGTNATFCSPGGMAIKDSKTLYIADGCNNSIRQVDLNTMNVSTLISDNPLLKRPTDIEILDDTLFISTMDKENQILKYNLKNNELINMDCNDCDRYILKLGKFNNKVYFLSRSGLNSIDNNGNIELEFNISNLDNNDIKINIDNNFHIDETGVYIVDKFDNKILRIKDNKIYEYSYNKDEKIYNLPTDIIDFRDKLYITNENDKKLIQLDKNTKETKVINITFGYEYNKVKGLEEKFLDVNNIQETVVRSGTGNKIYLNLKNGYSFEKMAPQSLALYRADIKNGAAILIKNYSKSEILENTTLELPQLENNTIYYLRGSFYYCNFDEKTPCLINSYNRKITTSNDSINNQIVIDFLYQ